MFVKNCKSLRVQMLTQFIWIWFEQFIRKILMNYSYAYWFSRAEDELFLLMIKWWSSWLKQIRYEDLMSNGNHLFDKKRKKNSSSVHSESFQQCRLSFSQWSFRTFANNLSRLYVFIRSFYVVSVQSSILAIHRYVLAFESKKKTRWETCSHSSENRSISSRTQHHRLSRSIYSCLFMVYMWKKFPFRPSVHSSIWFLIEWWSYPNVPSAICASIIWSVRPSHNHQHRSLWLSLAHGFIHRLNDYSQRFYLLWFYKMFD